MAEPAHSSTKQQDLEVLLHGDLLEELLFAAQYRRLPCVAVLYGLMEADDDGQLSVSIRRFAGLDYLESLHNLHVHARNTIEASFREMILKGGLHGSLEQVVGLFLSNPGSEALLDEHLMRTQLTLLNLPWQLSVVLDPTTELLAIYGRSDDGPFLNLPFRVIGLHALDPQARESLEDDEEE